MLLYINSSADAPDFSKDFFGKGPGLKPPPLIILTVLAKSVWA